MSRDSFGIPESFGKYTQLEYVGEGGMATVYRAYDTSLNREVALKIVAWSEPEATERFLLEARSQARLDHEHICRVYEVGMLNRRRYIAMQFIHGETLIRLMNKLTLEQKVRLIQQVAFAVHAAHRAGLIHRDMKPSNIMVEKDEHGQWKPYVMDFGLAREAQAPGLTDTGIVIGSPWYMSPEQARGVVHTLDRRCDVYSLGVTLYELLTGRLPYEAESGAGVLVKLLSEEPVTLRARDPHAPLELNTITMKCLEKDPLRRYESARALAEDLDRYLKGEPIQARPAGWGTRVVKKIKKHKAVSGVIILAVAAMMVIGGWMVHALWQGREQAALAQRFGQEAERIEIIMTRGALLPEHNVRGERAKVREKMVWIEQQMQRLGAVSRGPGHYALGRGYLTLHDNESALANLKKAWNEDGYRPPQVASALGLSLAELYQEKLDLAARIPNQAVREQKVKELMLEYAKPALAMIELGKGEDTEAPEFLQARIAFLEKRYEDALIKTQKAFAKHPWLYAARRLEGNIFLAQGLDAQNAGNLSAAIPLFEKASSVFKEAAEIGRSDSLVYQGQCALGIRWIELEQAHGEEAVRRAFDSARSFCDSAITIDPERSNPYVKRSWVYLRLGEYQALHGEDPRESLSVAIENAERAADINPQDDSAYDNIGISYWRKGEYENDHGLDPRASLNSAIQASLHATRINPNNIWLYNNMGLAYWGRAIYEGDHGGSPFPFLKNAVSSYEKAISINPQYFWPYNNLGNTYARMGLYESRSGKDPRVSQEKAILYYRKAMQINPNMADAYNNAGTVFQVRAGAEMGAGRDPGPFFREALSLYAKAASLAPGYVWPLVNAAQCRQSLGQYQLEHNSDPTTELEEGRSTLQKAVEIHPGAAEIPLARATIELVAARWAARNGRPAERFFREAERYFLDAVKLDSDNPEIYADGADVYRRYAEWNLQLGKSAGALIERGLQAADKALSIDPGYSPALGCEGALYLIIARTERDPAMKKEKAERARDALANAIRLSPPLKTDFGPLLEEAQSLL